ncbi:hypothetical protein [Paraburkholderia lacunae]|uniref:LamG domain-containing protein n=1 Tax=Paraburkholderia lacunae TaxID=2211104 RepID=A0A370N733_9BURK|nr:hypothetical protein [Paraburkholderia lacunae]RDK01427.1 hypothetical protein DLM46_16485 [Paraburkholderia lacunae]
MSLILKITDTTFTDATLPVLQRDGLVDAGMKFLFDFADPYCWPKQAAPVNNDQFTNLVSGGAAAVTFLAAPSTMTFATGGIGFDTETNEGILLPNSGNLPANNQGFVFCIWLKHLAQADQTSVSAVGGYSYQLGTSNQYAIIGQNSSNTYRMYANGQSVSVPFPANGAILQLAVAVVKVGSNMVLRAYMNGAQYGADVGLGAASTFSLNQVASAQMACPELGFLAGAGQGWVGSIYRTWLDDTGSTGVDPLAILQADYAVNSARFT